MTNKKKHKGKKTNNIGRSSHKYKPYITLGLICLLTTLAFWPIFTADFVNWDDEHNVYENPYVLDFDIVGIFKSGVIGNYNPLTILVFAIQKAVFGLNPKIFHLVNFTFHLFNVILVYRLFKQLGLTYWGSVIGTVLFAIHPMRVESVAWITELKDVLFGFFFLLSLTSYIHHRNSPNRSWPFFSFIYFFIGLFAKIQMVTLPLTLVVVDYWIDKKISLQNVISKWPFFITSLAFGAAGLFLLQEQGSLSETVQYGLGGRLVIGGYSLIIYLIKFVFPYEMLPIYAYPISLPNSYFILAGCSVLYLLFLAWSYHKKWHAFLFGNIFFVLNIMFLLQILNAGQGLKADRFTYVAYIGLFFLVGLFISKAFTIKPNFAKFASPLFLIILGGMMYMTHTQAKIWTNSETLWTHVIDHQKGNSLNTTAYRNRGNYYRDNGQYDKALLDLNTILSVKKDDYKIYNSRAKIYFDQKKPSLAIKDYTAGLKLSPDNVEMRVNRGAAFAMTNHFEAALSDLNKALETDPSNTNGYLNRSLVLQQLERHQEAHGDIINYLQYNPNNGDLWYEKARLEHRFGNLDQALKDFQTSLKAGPIRNSTYYQLALVYLSMNNKILARKNMDIAQSMGLSINSTLSDQIYK